MTKVRGWVCSRCDMVNLEYQGRMVDVCMEPRCGGHTLVMVYSPSAKDAAAIPVRWTANSPKAGG